MLEVEFFVAGKPEPQPRARISGARSRSHRVYTPRTAEAWRQRVALAGRQAWGREPLLGAIRVEITFVLPRPPSHFRRAGGLRSTAPAHPIAKPDRDNILKSTQDALTGVLWKDDAQIVGGDTVKRYLDEDDVEPGAYISVRCCE